MMALLNTQNPYSASENSAHLGMRSEIAMPRGRAEATAIDVDYRRAFLQVKPGVVGLAGLEPAASS
jgi:hypothetical protein